MILRGNFLNRNSLSLPLCHVIFHDIAHNNRIRIPVENLSSFVTFSLSLSLSFRSFNINNNFCIKSKNFSYMSENEWLSFVGVGELSDAVSILIIVIF